MRDTYSFSVMQSTFCFSNVEIMTVLTASLIYNFHIVNGCACLCREKRLNVMIALENDPEVNASIKFIDASLQLLGITYYNKLLCNPKKEESREFQFRGQLWLVLFVSFVAYREHH